MTAATQRYTTGAIILHWAIAVMIVLQVIGGVWMTGLADSALKFNVYQFHKTAGLIVLFLSLARIAWRILNPPPPMPPMPGWQATIAKATHWIFYGLIIAIPLTGWMYVSASPRGVPTLLFNLVEWPHLAGLVNMAVSDVETGGCAGFAFTKSCIAPILSETHEILAFATMGLLVLHLGAALKHQFVDKDQLLARMAPRVFGPTLAVAPSPRSTSIAALVFFVPLALGLAAAMLSGSGASTTPSETQNQAEPSGAETWAVDHDQSRLFFTVTYNGQDLTGDIPNWRADIQFDPNQLEQASATIVIDAATIKTGDAFFDNTMARSDGLQLDRYPQITVALTNFRQGVDTDYVANAEVSMVNRTKTLEFPFSLAIDDDTAKMSGELDFDRFDFDLGRINDPNANYVSETVTVSANVTAARSP